MEIKTSIEYIGEYESVHVIRASLGTGSRVIQLMEEDLKKYEEEEKGHP